LDERCFLRHDFELLGRAPVAEGNRTADPNPFAFRSGDLVPDPFANNLAFELGEGEKDIEGEPAHARGRVEGLGDRDEGDGMFVEELNELGKVGE
jgi:hypothetical protein